MLQTEQIYDKNKRKMLKLGLFYLAGAAIFDPSQGLAAEIPAYTSSDSDFPVRFRQLEAIAHHDQAAFFAQTEQIRSLGVDLFVAEMASSYGISYDPDVLAPQVNISDNDAFVENVRMASGCKSKLTQISAGISNADWSSVIINGEVIFASAAFSEDGNPTGEAIKTVTHELGHHTSEENTDPEDLKLFEEVAAHPGSNLVGIKGFGLVIEYSKYNKPDRRCVGTTDMDLLMLEEAFVEKDAQAAALRAHIPASTPAHSDAVDRLESLLARLTPADRRLVGIKHKSSGLPGFLGFYKQNFNIPGEIGEVYTQLNQRLHGIG